MDDEVGKSADRRGEVGVARECEAKMTEIVRAVDGLALAAQDGLADELGHRLVGDLVQDTVEVGRAKPLAGRDLDAECPEELAQGLELGEVGLVVDAVEAGRMTLFQRLGRRHVSQHHELFDELVAGETLAHANRGDVAVLAQRHLALGQVEVERTAGLPRRQQDAVGAVERPHDAIHQRFDLGVRRAVHGALYPVVGEAGGRAHHGAMEFVSLEMAFGVDPHFGDQHRAILARHQRAPVIG